MALVAMAALSSSVSARERLHGQVDAHSAARARRGTVDAQGSLRWISRARRRVAVATQLASVGKDCDSIASFGRALSCAPCREAKNGALSQLSVSYVARGQA